MGSTPKAIVPPCTPISRQCLCQPAILQLRSNKTGNKMPVTLRGKHPPEGHDFQGSRSNYSRREKKKASQHSSFQLSILALTNPLPLQFGGVEV
ncbi:hypothetical protein P7K49_030908 [Saguinus oedipus]|uniref:Uncharacterized protein n=1 Tax=Saguinus oedipus TaxID=9490 RepID=A0ABQ9U3H5_SAGOE|nr:hypothetical protein P7K49_030908 [Saguinus oedipus]